MASPSPSSQEAQEAPDNSDQYQFDQAGRPTRMIWNNDPVGAANYRHRVKFPPHVDPNIDPTIAQVVARREDHIADMIQAVYDLSTAKDGPRYEGRALFTRGGVGSICVPDVEAACRALFEQILHQCRVGWTAHQNMDRLVRTKDKTVGDDMTSNCERRITNSIRALRDWKSVCKEVVYQDEKIANLANAPLTVHRDKTNQQGANEAKKRTKEKEQNALIALENRGKSPTEAAQSPAPPKPVVKNARAKRGRGAQQTIVAPTNTNIAPKTTGNEIVDLTLDQIPGVQRAGARRGARESPDILESPIPHDYSYHHQNEALARPPAHSTFTPVEAPFGGVRHNQQRYAPNAQHFDNGPYSPIFSADLISSDLTYGPVDPDQHYANSQARAPSAYMYHGQRLAPQTEVLQHPQYAEVHQSMHAYAPSGFYPVGRMGCAPDTPLRYAPAPRQVAQPPLHQHRTYRPETSNANQEVHNYARRSLGGASNAATAWVDDLSPPTPQKKTSETSAPTASCSRRTAPLERIAQQEVRRQLQSARTHDQAASIDELRDIGTGDELTRFRASHRPTAYRAIAPKPTNRTAAAIVPFQMAPELFSSTPSDSSDSLPAGPSSAPVRLAANAVLGAAPIPLALFARSPAAAAAAPVPRPLAPAPPSRGTKRARADEDLLDETRPNTPESKRRRE
ncbi:hypothetical protein N0V83_006390 [Neocucurbitaria cava]|uniref:Uncharacterized protein n=1 Tax=Neocucurbitaria cava TaxID=798079 RepID=A0A9W8Y568_9PLEO|nr:hypothetical protein N0V83_006390 [Neocucurbitaria cava]